MAMTNSPLNGLLIFFEWLLCCSLLLFTLLAWNQESPISKMSSVRSELSSEDALEMLRKYPILNGEYLDSKTVWIEPKEEGRITEEQPPVTKGK